MWVIFAKRCKTSGSETLARSFALKEMRPTDSTYTTHVTGGQSNPSFNLSRHLTIPELKRRCPAAFITTMIRDIPSSGMLKGLPERVFRVTISISRSAQTLAHPNAQFQRMGSNGTPARPPVVLENWPVASQPRLERFTTVASWRGAYSSIQFNG